MPYFYFDWTYLIFIVPCMIISALCQAKVSSAFSKYSKIPNSRQMTGAQAAEYVLRQNGVSGVRIERVAGKLTDHFDPRTNVIRLSESVFDSASVAAVGVAAHEAGHAVQEANGYVPNKIRSFIVPIANIGSKISWILFLVGFLFAFRINTQFGQTMLYAGIILFSLSVLFTLITLPVEFNASKRALNTIKTNNLLREDEYKGVKSVLTAAAMTYVASAITAIMQMVRLIFIARRRS
jgi:Zn-dependent membrane protease YugP